MPNDSAETPQPTRGATTRQTVSKARRIKTVAAGTTLGQIAASAHHAAMWGCVEFLPLRSGPFWVFALWAVGVALLMALLHAGRVSVRAGRRVVRLFIGQALLVLGGALGGAALRQHGANPSDLYLVVLIVLQLSFPAGFLWLWAAQRSRRLPPEPGHAELAAGCSFPVIIVLSIALGIAAGLAIFVDFVARHLLEGPGAAHLEHLYWGLAVALAALWRVERGVAQPASSSLWRSLGLATGALWSLGVLGLLKWTSNNGVAASDQCLVEHLLGDLVNGHAAEASLRELKVRPAPRFTSFSLERQRIVAQALHADWQMAKDKRWTSTSVVMLGSPPPFFDDPAASLLEIQMQRGSFAEALSWLNDDRVAEETRVRLIGLFAQHTPVCPDCDPFDTLTTVLELCENPRLTTAGCDQVSQLLDSLTRPPWSVTPRFAFAALPALLRYLADNTALRLLDHPQPHVARAARLRLALLLEERPSNSTILDDTDRECRLILELRSDYCGAASGPLGPSACSGDIHERKRLVDSTAKEIQACVGSRPPTIAPEFRPLLRHQ